MARGKTKKKENEEEDMEATNPEITERKRRKALAFSNNLLSETPARSSVHLQPSSLVIKHHGKDIIKKSQRKSSRFLFSFPGLLAPISGGKIGELKDLGTKNPILYLDFPQGQMKLFGTIVYPKNRYLTLQFSRGGKSVMCEDYFDNMIVFSDAWWIGKKDENPEEVKLEFPKELYEAQQAEYDFKGGAGSASVVNQAITKTKVHRAEQESPKTPSEDDISDSEMNSKDTKELVPARHSARTARKSYKFGEISSGDDSDESSTGLSEHEEKVEKDVFEIDDDEDAAQGVDELPQENKMFASAAVSTEVVSSNRGSLVQATISTLFKKVEEKKAPKNSRKSPSSKASGQKSQSAGSKRKIDVGEESRKRARKIKDKDSGKKVMEKSEEFEVDNDDEIEEFSNASEDTDGSDEDWIG